MTVAVPLKQADQSLNNLEALVNNKNYVSVKEKTSYAVVFISDLNHTLLNSVELLVCLSVWLYPQDRYLDAIRACIIMSSLLFDVLLFLTMNNDVTQFTFVMAFSVGAWLKATGYSQYEPNFRKHGYTSYHTVKELSRVDLEAAGVKDYGITRLASDVDYLKAVSEDEAIRKLSVSVLVYTWLIIVCL